MREEHRGFCFDAAGNPISMNSLGPGDVFFWATEGWLLRWLGPRFPKLWHWLVMRLPRVQCHVTGITGRNGEGEFEIDADMAT